jgi:tRNA(adenine34) deaminase
LNDAWHEAMGVALHQATLAAEAGDVPVGAVVLEPHGAILATGHNTREASADPTGHAELMALRAAAAMVGRWRLEGCTLVVTLEPCAMCAGASVLARLERLVYGAPDPRAGAAGSMWDLVRDPRLNHRLEVRSGVRAEECGALLQAFFATHRSDATPPVAS